MSDPQFALRMKAWFTRSLAALVVGASLVLLCYLFVDRSVAEFVHYHKVNTLPILKEVTLPPPIAQYWTPAGLVFVVVCFSMGHKRRWLWALLIAGVALILADQFRESLSLVLARYWPETWRGNPSFIGTGTYGFVLFGEGKDFGSFPSGHMARTAAVIAVVWSAWPRWRWVAILVLLLEAVALVGMNYHFVSDVIAGAVIGWLVGFWVWGLANQDSLELSAGMN